MTSFEVFTYFFVCHYLFYYLTRYSKKNVVITADGLDGAVYVGSVSEIDEASTSYSSQFYLPAGEDNVLKNLQWNANGILFL